MEMKKLLALALVGAISLSMLTACGGDDNGDDTDLSNDTELVQEDGDGAVTDETWNTMMTNAVLLGKYNQEVQALGADIPDELVSYLQEINGRVNEVAALEKATTTEEEAVAANNDILSWIDTFSQYVTIDESGSSGAEAGNGVSDETWEFYTKALYTMDKLVEVMEQDTPEDAAAAVSEIIAFSEKIAPKQREEYTEESAQEVIATMKGYIELMGAYVNVTEDGTITRK